MAPCLACGARALVTLDVSGAPVLPEPPPAAPAGALPGETTHHHTCAVCGDHRVSIRRRVGAQAEHVTLHLAPAAPLLRQVGRVRGLETGAPSAEWTHFVDEVEVEAAYWQARLDDRRRVRLATIAN